MEAPGNTRWVIARAVLPPRVRTVPGRLPQIVEAAPEEGAVLLNAGTDDATVTVTFYFAHREPLGPCPLGVPARSSQHIEFADLGDARAMIAPGTEFSIVIESDRPIVVEQTYRRLADDHQLQDRTVAAYAV